jgi:hypothetical protein
MKPLYLAVFAAVVSQSLWAQSVEDQIQSLQKEADKLQDQAAAARDKLLLPIKVNGVALDPKIVKRETVYLTGGKLVEAKVADFFIVEEVKKQIEAGKRRPEEFDVLEEDVLRELEPENRTRGACGPPAPRAASPTLTLLFGRFPLPRSRRQHEPRRGCAHQGAPLRRRL